MSSHPFGEAPKERRWALLDARTLRPLIVWDLLALAIEDSLRYESELERASQWRW